MKLGTWSKKRLSTGILLAIGLCCSARADGLTISPVVIEMDSPRRVVAVTVTNNADHAATFQTDTVVWRQDNGIDRYEPTDELLVVPPIVQVPPHASQIFRVTLRVPTNSLVERSYRLILEDITEQLSASGQTSVAFKFAHNLPVMVAPSAKLASAAQWKPCGPGTASTLPGSAASAKLSDGPSESCVRLRNSGNHRMKVQALTLKGQGGEQVLLLKDGFNVVVGAEYEWRIPLQPGQTSPASSLQIRTAGGEMLQAQAGGF